MNVDRNTVPAVLPPSHYVEFPRLRRSCARVHGTTRPPAKVVYWAKPSASSSPVIGHAYLAELAVAVERDVTTHRLDHTIASEPGDDSRGQSTPPAGTFASVKTGGLHSCGRRTDDTVACWGDNVTASPRRLRGRSSWSAPAEITPAECGRTAPWPAGVTTPSSSRGRPRARSSRSAPALFTPAGGVSTTPSPAGG
jgi:hypothetical protein